MTVGDLIDLLSRYPKDMEVFVRNNSTPTPFIPAAVALEEIGERDGRIYWVTDDWGWTKDALDNVRTPLIINVENLDYK